MKCWPEDAGHYITLPLVFTHDPNTGKRNVGMYRLQIFDERTIGMHWQLHKGGMSHYKESLRAAKRMEIAVAVGAEPVLTYAATAPLPPEIDEMVFAGFLRDKAVEMVRCKTVDVLAPANAEIVIEGYVDPSELRTEGPFGDHTGVYSLADEYPVLARDGHHPSPQSDLRFDDCGQAADGRRLHRRRHRATLPAADKAYDPRAGGHPSSGRFRVPQFRHRVDSQTLSRVRPAR